MPSEQDTSTRRAFLRNLTGVGMLSLGIAGVGKTIEYDNSVYIEENSEARQHTIEKNQPPTVIFITNSLDRQAFRELIYNNLLGLLSFAIGTKGYLILRELDNKQENED